MAKKKVPREQSKDYDPPRQIGRVSHEQWQELKDAAARKGVNFTQWALAILLKAARK